MKISESFKDVFDRFTIYRSSKLGSTLIAILINLYKKNKIKTGLIFKILNKFDEYIYFLLKKKIYNHARLRGFLDVYRNVENIWFFSIDCFKFFMDIRNFSSLYWRIDAFCEHCDVLLVESEKKASI